MNVTTDTDLPVVDLSELKKHRVDYNVKDRITRQIEALTKKYITTYGAKPPEETVEAWLHDVGIHVIVAIHGIVYDLTRFVVSHPGGISSLLVSSGVDATRVFECVGHTYTARTMMASYAIAKLASPGKNTSDTVNRTSVHTNQDRTPSTSLASSFSTSPAFLTPSPPLLLSASVRDAHAVSSGTADSCGNDGQHVHHPDIHHSARTHTVQQHHSNDDNIDHRDDNIDNNKLSDGGSSLDALVHDMLSKITVPSVFQIPSTEKIEFIVPDLTTILQKSSLTDKDNTTPSVSTGFTSMSSTFTNASTEIANMSTTFIKKDEAIELDHALDNTYFRETDVSHVSTIPDTSFFYNTTLDDKKYKHDDSLHTSMNVSHAPRLPLPPLPLPSRSRAPAHAALPHACHLTSTSTSSSALAASHLSNINAQDGRSHNTLPTTPVTVVTTPIAAAATPIGTTNTSIRAVATHIGVANTPVAGASTPVTYPNTHINHEDTHTHTPTYTRTKPTSRSRPPSVSPQPPPPSALPPPPPPSALMLPTHSPTPHSSFTTSISTSTSTSTGTSTVTSSATSSAPAPAFASEPVAGLTPVPMLIPAPLPASLTTYVHTPAPPPPAAAASASAHIQAPSPVSELASPPVHVRAPRPLDISQWADASTSFLSGSLLLSPSSSLPPSTTATALVSSATSSVLSGTHLPSSSIATPVTTYKAHDLPSTVISPHHHSLLTHVTAAVNARISLQEKLSQLTKSLQNTSTIPSPLPAPVPESSSSSVAGIATTSSNAPSNATANTTPNTTTTAPSAAPSAAPSPPAAVVFPTAAAMRVFHPSTQAPAYTASSSGKHTHTLSQPSTHAPPPSYAALPSLPAAATHLPSLSSLSSATAVYVSRSPPSAAQSTASPQYSPSSQPLPDATTFHGDSSPVQGDAAPLPSNAQPLYGEYQPLHSDLSPIPSVNTSLHSDNPSLNSTTASPQHSEHSSLHSDGSPLHSDIIPTESLHSDIYLDRSFGARVLTLLGSVTAPLHSVADPLGDVDEPLHDVIRLADANLADDDQANMDGIARGTGPSGAVEEANEIKSTSGIDVGATAGAGAGINVDDFSALYDWENVSRESGDFPNTFSETTPPFPAASAPKATCATPNIETTSASGSVLVTSSRAATTANAHRTVADHAGIDGVFAHNAASGKQNYKHSYDRNSDRSESNAGDGIAVDVSTSSRVDIDGPSPPRNDTDAPVYKHYLPQHDNVADNNTHGSNSGSKDNHHITSDHVTNCNNDHMNNEDNLNRTRASASVSPLIASAVHNTHPQSTHAPSFSVHPKSSSPSSLELSSAWQPAVTGRSPHAYRQARTHNAHIDTQAQAHIPTLAQTHANANAPADMSATSIFINVPANTARASDTAAAVAVSGARDDSAGTPGDVGGGAPSAASGAAPGDVAGADPTTGSASTSTSNSASNSASSSSSASLLHTVVSLLSTLHKHTQKQQKQPRKQRKGAQQRQKHEHVMNSRPTQENNSESPAQLRQNTENDTDPEECEFCKSETSGKIGGEIFPGDVSASACDFTLGLCMEMEGTMETMTAAEGSGVEVLPVESKIYALDQENAVRIEGRVLGRTPLDKESKGDNLEQEEAGEIEGQVETQVYVENSVHASSWEWELYQRTDDDSNVYHDNANGDGPFDDKACAVDVGAAADGNGLGVVYGVSDEDAEGAEGHVYVINSNSGGIDEIDDGEGSSLNSRPSNNGNINDDGAVNDDVLGDITVVNTTVVAHKSPSHVRLQQELLLHQRQQHRQYVHQSPRQPLLPNQRPQHQRQDQWQHEGIRLGQQSSPRGLLQQQQLNAHLQSRLAPPPYPHEQYQGTVAQSSALQTSTRGVTPARHGGSGGLGGVMVANVSDVIVHNRGRDTKMGVEIGAGVTGSGVRTDVVPASTHISESILFTTPLRRNTHTRTPRNSHTQSASINTDATATVAAAFAGTPVPAQASSQYSSSSLLRQAASSPSSYLLHSYLLSPPRWAPSSLVVVEHGSIPSPFHRRVQPQHTAQQHTQQHAKQLHDIVSPGYQHDTTHFTPHEHTPAHHSLHPHAPQPQPQSQHTPLHEYQHDQHAQQHTTHALVSQQYTPLPAGDTSEHRHRHTWEDKHAASEAQAQAKEEVENLEEDHYSAAVDPEEVRIKDYGADANTYANTSTNTSMHKDDTYEDADLSMDAHMRVAVDVSTDVNMNMDGTVDAYPLSGKEEEKEVEIEPLWDKVEPEEEPIEQIYKELEEEDEVVAHDANKDDEDEAQAEFVWEHSLYSYDMSATQRVEAHQNTKHTATASTHEFAPARTVGAARNTQPPAHELTADFTITSTSGSDLTLHPTSLPSSVQSYPSPQLPQAASSQLSQSLQSPSHAHRLPSSPPAAAFASPSQRTPIRQSRIGPSPQPQPQLQHPSPQRQAPSPQTSHQPTSQHHKAHHLVSPQQPPSQHQSAFEAAFAGASPSRARPLPPGAAQARAQYPHFTTSASVSPPSIASTTASRTNLTSNTTGAAVTGAGNGAAGAAGAVSLGLGVATVGAAAVRVNVPIRAGEDVTVSASPSYMSPFEAAFASPVRPMLYPAQSKHATVATGSPQSQHSTHTTHHTHSSHIPHAAPVPHTPLLPSVATASPDFSTPFRNTRARIARSQAADTQRSPATTQRQSPTIPRPDVIQQTDVTQRQFSSPQRHSAFLPLHTPHASPGKQPNPGKMRNPENTKFPRRSPFSPHSSRASSPTPLPSRPPPPSFPPATSSSPIPSDSMSMASSSMLSSTARLHTHPLHTLGRRREVRIDSLSPQRSHHTHQSSQPRVLPSSGASSPQRRYASTAQPSAPQRISEGSILPPPPPSAPDSRAPLQTPTQSTHSSWISRPHASSRSRSRVPTVLSPSISPARLRGSSSARSASRLRSPSPPRVRDNGTENTLITSPYPFGPPKGTPSRIPRTPQRPKGVGNPENEEIPRKFEIPDEDVYEGSLSSPLLPRSKPQTSHTPANNNNSNVNINPHAPGTTIRTDTRSTTSTSTLASTSTSASLRSTAMKMDHEVVPFPSLAVAGIEEIYPQNTPSQQKSPKKSDVYSGIFESSGNPHMIFPDMNLLPPPRPTRLGSTSPPHSPPGSVSQSAHLPRSPAPPSSHSSHSSSSVSSSSSSSSSAAWHSSPGSLTTAASSYSPKHQHPHSHPNADAPPHSPSTRALRTIPSTTTTTTTSPSVASPQRHISPSRPSSRGARMPIFLSASPSAPSKHMRSQLAANAHRVPNILPARQQQHLQRQEQSKNEVYFGLNDVYSTNSDIHFGNSDSNLGNDDNMGYGIADIIVSPSIHTHHAHTHAHALIPATHTPGATPVRISGPTLASMPVSVPVSVRDSVYPSSLIPAAGMSTTSNTNGNTYEATGSGVSLSRATHNGINAGVGSINTATTAASTSTSVAVLNVSRNLSVPVHDLPTGNTATAMHAPPPATLPVSQSAAMHVSISESAPAHTGMSMPVSTLRSTPALVDPATTLEDPSWLDETYYSTHYSTHVTHTYAHNHSLNRTTVAGTGAQDFTAAPVPSGTPASGRNTRMEAALNMDLDMDVSGLWEVSVQEGYWTPDHSLM